MGCSTSRARSTTPNVTDPRTAELVDDLVQHSERSEAAWWLLRSWDAVVEGEATVDGHVTATEDEKAWYAGVQEAAESGTELSAVRLARDNCTVLHCAAIHGAVRFAEWVCLCLSPP